MPEPVTARDFFEFAIGLAEHEHSELSDTWKVLDTKAQATAATAGIFVAAAFAFVRNPSLELVVAEKLFLLLALGCLIVSIYYAVSSMRIREIPIPPTAADVVEEAKTILQSSPQPGELDERFARLIASAVDEWTEVNSKLRKVLNAKADAIKLAQNAILLALGSVAILTGSTILRT